KDSNEHACWENGWEHGHYDAAVRDSDEDEQEISCRGCTAEGKRVRLRDGSFLWDPDGYICSDSDPNGASPVSDDVELLFCKSCHTTFDYWNHDFDFCYANEIEDNPCSSQSVDAIEICPVAANGYVYVVCSNRRIRIGKAKSP